MQLRFASHALCITVSHWRFLASDIPHWANPWVLSFLLKKQRYLQVVAAVGFMGRRLEIPSSVDPKVAAVIESCWVRYLILNIPAIMHLLITQLSKLFWWTILFVFSENPGDDPLLLVSWNPWNLSSRHYHPINSWKKISYTSQKLRHPVDTSFWHLSQQRWLAQYLLNIEVPVILYIIVTFEYHIYSDYGSYRLPHLSYSSRKRISWHHTIL